MLEKYPKVLNLPLRMAKRKLIETLVFFATALLCRKYYKGVFALNM